MTHKHSLEALNCTLKYLKGKERLFVGTLILLSRDFRQTLPVNPCSTYADEINAFFKASSLWSNVHKFKLTTNIRVQLQNDLSATIFSKQLLDIEEGKININQMSQTIKLPDNFCIIVPSTDALVQNVFPNIRDNINNHQWLSEGLF